MQSKQNKIQITLQRYLWSMNKLEELPLKPKNKHQPYRVVMTTQKGRTCRERRWCCAHVARAQLSCAESTKNREPAVFR